MRTAVEWRLHCVSAAEVRVQGGLFRGQVAAQSALEVADVQVHSVTMPHHIAPATHKPQPILYPSAKYTLPYHYTIVVAVGLQYVTA